MLFDVIDVMGKLKIRRKIFIKSASSRFIKIEIKLIGWRMREPEKIQLNCANNLKLIQNKFLRFLMK